MTKGQGITGRRGPPGGKHRAMIRRVGGKTGSRLKGRNSEQIPEETREEKAQPSTVKSDKTSLPPSHIDGPHKNRGGRGGRKQLYKNHRLTGRLWG